MSCPIRCNITGGAAIPGSVPSAALSRGRLTPHTLDQPRLPAIPGRCRGAADAGAIGQRPAAHAARLPCLAAGGTTVRLVALLNLEVVPSDADSVGWLKPQVGCRTGSSVISASTAVT